MRAFSLFFGRESQTSHPLPKGVFNMRMHHSEHIGECGGILWSASLLHFFILGPSGSHPVTRSPDFSRPWVWPARMALIGSLPSTSQTRPAGLQLSVLCLGRSGVNHWLSSALREDEGLRCSSCLQVAHIVWPGSVIVSPFPPSTCPGIFLASCYPALEGAEKPPHTETPRVRSRQEGLWGGSRQRF